MNIALPYRKSVGLCLFNKKGLVLCAERSDKPGCWQMPQGGVNDGEDLRCALFREMREEIGNDKGEIITQHSKKLRYDFPNNTSSEQRLFNGQYCGQEQIWFAVRYLGEDTDIDLNSEHEENDPEFLKWRWIKLRQSLELIVDFKRSVYEKVVAEFEPIGEALARDDSHSI